MRVDDDVLGSRYASIEKQSPGCVQSLRISLKTLWWSLLVDKGEVREENSKGEERREHSSITSICPVDSYAEHFFGYRTYKRQPGYVFQLAIFDLLRRLTFTYQVILPHAHLSRAGG